MTACFIVDGTRTHFGRYGGALAGIRPDDLAASVVASIMRRNPDLDPSCVEDVYFGDANGAGEDNRNVARMACLLAGLPTSVPGATVNRLCGSGMEAAIEASRAIETGDAEVMLAGGVESMTRAPWVLPKPEGAFPRGNATMHSTTLGWRMVNERMPTQWTVSLGEGAEIMADKYSLTREEQDVFAIRSHRRAAAAWAAGEYDDEITLVEGVALEMDESIRADTTLEKLARLRPAFRRDGTVTAGNASPLNDGAAALLLMEEATASRQGARPLARIVSRATTGVDPHLFGIAPVEAANKALARAGIGWGDVASVELNEAFASQSLACIKSWPELDPQNVNPSGGAIAIGHPLGASGARLLTTLAWRLHRAGGGYGLAAMCIGVGQGIAVVLEGV
ncbi:MAG: acetyl-CoA C-acyltransferase [Actinomycetota bacterium]|nr:acetyl-CoA C-acyltransferase [Actinomycetota bacterium]